MPLLSLPGGLHLRIPGSAPVLGGGGGRNQGGIHQRALAQPIPLCFQVGIQFRKDGLAQGMRLQQMSKLAQGRLVRHRVLPAQTPKAAHGRGILDRLLRAGVGQVVPLRQQVVAHHPFPIHALAPRPWPIRPVMGADGVAEPRLGQEPVHLRQKGLAATGRDVKGGRRDLGHDQLRQTERRGDTPHRSTQPAGLVNPGIGVGSEPCPNYSELPEVHRRPSAYRRALQEIMRD